MSIFASHYRQIVPVADGAVTIRKLTGKEMDRARLAHLQSTISGNSPRSWSAFFQRKLAAVTGEAAERAAVEDPLNGFDPYVMLQTGIVAWSYPAAVTQEAIDDLDDDAVDLLAHAILRFSKPSLFPLTDEEAAAAEKESPAPAPVV